MNRLVVVELAGPLVDDRGAFSRTAAEVLRTAGVELPPRGLEQVVGGAPRWALETLLGGHGRDDLAGRLASMVGEVARGWEELVRSGSLASAPGAARWLDGMVAAGQEFLVFSQLPLELAEEVARKVGLPGLVGRMVAAEPPDAAALSSAMGRRPGSECTALVSSPAGILAASGARIGEVVLVGAASQAATMLPVDRWVGTIDEVLV